MIRTNQRKTWFGRFRGWMALAFVGASATAQPASTPGPAKATIGARFEIRAATFSNNLGPDRAQVEMEMATWMAEHCRSQLGFLDWQALKPQPSGDDPPWILKVIMANEGSSLIPAVTLLFEKIVNGVPQPLPIRESLYSANDLGQPTQESQRLRDDLRLKLGLILDNEQVIERLQLQFLRGIAVARRLQADPDNQRFLVPAAWADLLPGEGSIFRAEYQARRAGNPPIKVKVKMTPSEEWTGAIGCRVREFHFPPVDLDQPGWHPDIPQSLSNAVPDSILVFMDRYVKDYTFGTTTNGLVFTPFTPTAGGGGL
jgi:hypothetical protein